MIVTTDPLSAVPTNAAPPLFVMYGAVVSHQIEVIIGAIGAVVSKITGTVPVVVFPASVVTVAVGFEFVKIPTHVTFQPILGIGVHTSHGILKLFPVAILVQVIVTNPFVGFGVLVHTGATGTVVLIMNTAFVGKLIFHALSLAVITAVYVPSANAGVTGIL